MESYLEVWQGVFSRWTKFYFRIHQDTLLFGQTKQTIEYKIHLKVAQIITTVDDPICLIIHTGIETLYIRCNSIDEKVKWYKKLKQLQHEVEKRQYKKDINDLQKQLGKNSKLKILEQLTIELWKSHADLENILEDVQNIMRIPPPIKKVLDKLRITAQQIKFKNSQALEIIENYILDIKNKKNLSESINEIISRKNYDHSQINNTQFLSFDQSPKRKNKIFPTNNNQTKYMSFDYDYKYNGNVFEKESQQESNIKESLLKNNQVYHRFKLTNDKERYNLPQKFTPEEKFPLFSVLSSSVGDLTKVSLPVTINEPLSVLQKACQQMYYSQLLDSADKQLDPVRRMLYVVGFVVSQYSITDGRIKKPFNPLLGETFEYIDQKRQFQFISQQVSHHPPISATYCRSNHYQLMDDSRAQTSFGGGSIKVIPSSEARLILEKHKDLYRWSKCTLSLNGLLIGKSYIENYGDIKIICQKYDTESQLSFKQSSFWKRSELNVVQGFISFRKEKKYKIFGKWSDFLKAVDLTNNKEFFIWERQHKNNQEYYNYNQMSFQLNHLNKQNFLEIPPTDSRLRPDQRALEFRQIQLAGKEKHRLEEKQRARRKQYEMEKKVHQPLWFYKKDASDGYYYESNGKYWQERNKGVWAQSPNIY